MIEAVGRATAQGAIASIAAVLNGTCNLVLERCGQGLTLEEGLAQAKREGFAEAEASEDLSGRDAARKLRILCRHAFGSEPDELELEELDERVARLARDSVAAGVRLRQVAHAVKKDAQVHAAVKFKAVALETPFGRTGREWNTLEIGLSDGTHRVVTGRGAGRWPTTEAVMADLFEIRRRPSR